MESMELLSAKAQDRLMWDVRDLDKFIQERKIGNDY